MRLLLDTHALVWWTTDSPRLPQAARKAITDPDSTVLVSAISALEISTKYRLGKLDEAALLAHRFDEEVEAEGFEVLSVTSRQAQLAGALRIANKDPFDRVLIAQALLESLVLVSNERIFDTFGVQRLW